MSDPKKVELASPEWYELATKILAEVARECGEDDFQLSVCEVFIDAPKEYADEDGTMSWCFYIDGKDVRCEKGNSKDVDLYTCRGAGTPLTHGESTPRTFSKSRRRTRLRPRTLTWRSRVTWKGFRPGSSSSTTA